MSNRKPSQFLDQTATRLKTLEAEIATLDGKLVEQDIAARRLEADAGYEYAMQVDQIGTALKACGRKLDVDQWCKQTIGVDADTMRRRRRLACRWTEYEAKRREMGQCGQSGLRFALSLVKELPPSAERPVHAGTLRPTSRTKFATPTSSKHDIPNCQFITGDALIELRKLTAQSVNVIVTSPPYWPPKKGLNGGGVGRERTLEEYISNVVAIFREAKRVLKDNGTLWVSIDDFYREGDLLFVPSRLAIAMQVDGWICRSEIIWQKTARRSEWVNNRPSKDFEKLLLFTKQATGYYYDGDHIRVPLSRPYNTAGYKIRRTRRQPSDRIDRYYCNPLGPNSGSVWEIAPENYRGNHAATMPPELVRRCLLASCPDNGIVLDCFGGAGTTALVALQLGHRAISIEINPQYTKEAQQRITTELGASTPTKLAAD
jgi:site-specific DNA-methyltransferase (adenine-specific)